MNIKRTLNALMIAVLLTLSALPMAGAASEARILQQRMEQPQDLSDATLTLYVRHTGGAGISKVNVGGIDFEDAAIAENASETDLVTWILFDNSTAMPEELRAKATDLLNTLLDQKGRGEKYTFCTFSDKLSIKVRDSDDLSELRKYIDGLEYYDQPTYLMTALDEVLKDVADHLSDNEGKLVKFVRIVIISTGGGSVPTGTMLENLRNRLTASRSAVSGVPIYAIGCSNGSNDEILQQMYELSRQTYARYWNMDDVGASDIAKIMRWEEIPLTASVVIRDNERLPADTTQEITVTFDNDEIARASVLVPRIIPVSKPVDPDPLPIGMIILIVVIVLLLAGGGVAAFLLLKRKPDPFESTGDPVPIRTTPSAYDNNNDVTDYADEDDNDATIDIFSSNEDNSYRTLYLKDMDSPDRQFSASLRNRVSIGRSPDNVISLGYDKSISRRHCEIYYQNGELWIQDLGSSGGTYIGSDRVVNAMELPNGSNIRLGHVNYRVEVR